MKVLLGLLLLVASSYSKAPGDAEKYLLPGDLAPVHYNLSIVTNIEKFRLGQESTFVFSGVVEITIDAVKDNVSDVILHKYDDVDILSATITSLESGAPSRSVSVGSYDDETNKQTLRVSPPLRINEQYKLVLSYTGRNTNDLTGFYRSSYLVGLTRRWLLVTDFESFGARRAFPSFDEPAYKATFQLTVDYNQTLADDGYAAYFNTDVESEIIRNGRHITTFQKTALPLSTYLVAFIVADFVKSPEPTYFNSSYNGENGTKAFHTIGQPKYFTPRQDLVSQVAGPAALNFMTRKTNVGFGLNKVDQAGIPDFAAGAMENWGLVTYRENYVFWNENSGSTNQKQGVVTVTAHELGHQWFGDLVTLHWWSDLWLNEGFATFYEYHASDQIREPTLDTSSWDLIGQFVEDVVQSSAFPTDSYTTSRPLTSEQYDQDSIDGFFDNISYSKGGSVLRMLMHALGEDLFYSGLNRYLVSQKESVGTPEILLSSFDVVINDLPASERPVLRDTVANLFKVWHEEAGYPVLSVTRDGSKINIGQERFLLSSGSSSTKYNVPISYSTNLYDNFNNTIPVEFLLESDPSITIDLGDESTDWYVLNNQATGYYRINYDDDNWVELLNIILDPSSAQLINEYNQAQIIDDSAYLTRSVNKQYQPYGTFLKLLQSLKHQRSLIVWRTALRAMRFLINQAADHQEASSLLKGYFSSLIEPAFNELSLEVAETDSHTRKLLRVAVAEIACELDVADCKEKANQLFITRSVHPDLRPLVLCTGVEQAGAKDYENILREALASEQPERIDFMFALSCTSEKALLERLGEVMQSGVLSKLDKMDIIEAASKGNREQAEFALRMFHQEKLRITVDSQKILRSIGECVTSVEATRLMAAIDPVIAEMTSTNSIWRQKKLPEVLQWLKDNEV